MIGDMPNFVNSPYFVNELDNWHLKPNAPEEVVKEFNEYMKNDPYNKNKSNNKAKTFNEIV